MSRRDDSDKLPGPSDLPWGWILRWVAAIVALAVVIGVIFGIGAFALNWFQAGRDIVSPENVREQYRFFYDTIEDLEAQANKICIAEDAIDEAESEAIREQRRTQLISAEQVYFNVAADYDARAEDVFRGGVVRPRDLPDRAPGLDELKSTAERCKDN